MRNIEIVEAEGGLLIKVPEERISPDALELIKKLLVLEERAKETSDAIRSIMKKLEHPRYERCPLCINYQKTYPYCDTCVDGNRFRPKR